MKFIEKFWNFGKNPTKKFDETNTKNCLLIIISTLVITNIAILLNIPFLRPISGFLFLTILPGLLILHVLKLNKIGFLEKFILTWGLSISFLIFFGLFVNNLSLGLGYETPLATIPLLVSFNIALIVLGVIGYKTKTFEKSFIKTGLSKKNRLLKLNLSVSEKAFLIVPILFPALSIFGMHVMNITSNNTILMFLLFLIPIYVVFVCFFNQKFPKRIYPVVIFLISISLLLLLSLRSNYLIGADVHDEYYLFQATFDNLHWSILGYSSLDACLSISLLPAIYQSILNISPIFLWKILPSLLCSVFPLVIYVLSKKYIGESYAFVASIFFMSNNTFLWTEYYARGNLAMLFIAFAMMTLFSDKIEPLKKRILFITFMASCMVSHYSNTYAFFFIILATFVGIEILSKKYTFKKIISSTIVLLLFAMLFFWYSQVTGEAFNSGVDFFRNTFRTLNEFFVIESRRDTAQTLLGKDVMQMEIPSKIHWLFTWLTFVLIGIGVITLIIRRKEMSFPELKFKKLDILKAKFEVGYFVIVLACVGLLVTIISVPFVTKGYGVGRAYPMASTILSVFFVIGGIMIAKNLSFIKKALLKKPFLRKKSFTKRSHCMRNNEKNGLQVRAYLVILLVLIPYFLCVTGAMYNLFGVPKAVILNSEGEEHDQFYIHDQESYSARWLRNNGELEGTTIYIDAGCRLGVQIGRRFWYDFHSLFEEDRKIMGYIYLRYYNVVNGKILKAIGEEHSMAEYQGKFIDKSRIYDNGGSEILK